MAKMFYSKEEVQEKLGVSEDQVKQLVEQGQLREFRDGNKIMFKVDEVDNLHPAELPNTDAPDAQNDLGGGDEFDEIPLASDSGELDFSFSDTGSSIGLAPMDTGTSIGLMPSDTGDQISLDDTSSSSGDDKDDTVITDHGSSAIDDGDDSSDELEPMAMDPLAQTQLTPEFEDQISLDAGASGSGLLDLSREADDTSLGAELLEEIYPSADEGAIETQLPTQMDMVDQKEEVESMEVDTPALPEQQVTRVVRQYDASSGVYGAMLIIPFLTLIYMAFATVSATQDIQPSLLERLSKINWYIIGGAGAVTLLILIFGLVLGNKSGQPKAPKAAKVKKPKQKKVKTKKAKKGK